MNHVRSPQMVACRQYVASSWLALPLLYCPSEYFEKTASYKNPAFHFYLHLVTWSTLPHSNHRLEKSSLTGLGQALCILSVPTKPYCLPRLRASCHYHSASTADFLTVELRRKWTLGLLSLPSVGKVKIHSVECFGKNWKEDIFPWEWRIFLHV